MNFYDLMGTLHERDSMKVALKDKEEKLAEMSERLSQNEMKLVEFQCKDDQLEVLSH